MNKIKNYYPFFRHYATTEHCYSMQLGNNRVWDYVGDNFVHRLLQNKVDGKLVQGDAQESKESAVSTNKIKKYF